MTVRPYGRTAAESLMMSRPLTFAAGIFTGILNGSLEARDLASGALLWEYQTETSKRNAGWVLTTDRKFNGALTFPSQWREAPIVATAQQFAIGAIFSSPLVVGKTVYFGSTDGSLYALE